MTRKILKLLFLGDIFGEPGRRAVKTFVPGLREEHKLDLVLANCENAAAGRGISEKLAREIMSAGVDFMTSGNHVYGAKDSLPFLSSPDCPVLRPYNYSLSSPGRGIGVVTARNGVRVGVINIMGEIFMNPTVNLPFDSFDEAWGRLKDNCDLTVLDFHAETTSEKRAMGWHVDGKVQLMVGTHTHVQTADEEILPRGTAYITDLGMTGPYDSVIGMKKEVVLRKLRCQIPTKFEVADGDVRLCGAICEIDVDARRALKIERVQHKLK